MPWCVGWKYGPQCDGVRDVEASCHGWVEVDKTSVLRRGLMLLCEMSYFSSGTVIIQQSHYTYIATLLAYLP